MIKKWQAFTLIESLLVLFLVSAILFLPTLEIKKWQKRQRIDYFFASLERQLFLTQQSAVVSGKRTTIQGNDGKNEIAFNYFNRLLESKAVILALPTEVRLRKNFSLSFKARSGTINRITHFEFTSEIKPYQIQYQYFIGSGRFEKRV